MKDYLFVYGTLRKGYDLKLKDRVRSDLKYVGQGKVGASLYDLGRYPGAVRNNRGDEVIGDVFLLDDAPRVLQVLDKYEGVEANEPSNSEFIRRKSRIKLRSGKSINAWVYWYNYSIGGKPKIKYKNYLSYIRKK